MIVVGVVDYKGKKLGIYKDKSGKMHAVVPYCKHLGCELSWNNLEKTWDCPCHGSRYDYTGKIITEPTTESLDMHPFLSSCDVSSDKVSKVQC